MKVQRFSLKGLNGEKQSLLHQLRRAADLSPDIVGTPDTRADHTLAR